MAPHCNTTVTHCNTRQQTATHHGSTALRNLSYTPSLVHTTFSLRKYSHKFPSKRPTLLPKGSTCTSRSILCVNNTTQHVFTAARAWEPYIPFISAKEPHTAAKEPMFPAFLQRAHLSAKRALNETTNINTYRCKSAGAERCATSRTKTTRTNCSSRALLACSVCLLVIHPYLCRHLHTHMYIYIYIYEYICMCTYVYTYKYSDQSTDRTRFWLPRVSVCLLSVYILCVNIYIYVYMCVYMYICT